MSKKTKVTEFKTKRINHLTGGIISTFEIPDYPKSKEDEGVLINSFMALDGTYLGDYAQGWWYVKQNMVVCFEYPHGVSIVLKHHVKDYPYLEAYKTDGRIGGDDIKGYYGYSHRGGNLFKIGDRLFDETYEPKKEDYTESEWSDFEKARIDSIERNIKDGWIKNKEEGLKETPISDVIPFKMRGTKLIENWDEAKQAAINMSKYLS